MERSGRWLRVSTGRQDEGMQVPDVERWESEHEYDVQRVYTVHGSSAFKGNKKFDDEWAKVIRDINSGVITVLVVWKTDRIDRKLQTMNMLEEVRQAGGRVEFVTQPHLNELTTMGGRIALNVQQEIAHEESRTKSDRAIMTRDNLRAAGSITSRPPFGYVVVGERKAKRFEVVDKLRPVIIEIFNHCIAGDSLETIARWLDSEGIPTSRGGKWSKPTIKDIINNRVYIGYIQDNSGRTIGTCPAIIDAAIWKAAGDKLHSRPKRGPQQNVDKALCAGSIFCGQCAKDSPMYRLRGGRPNGRIFYYRCAGRGAQARGCGTMVRLDAVDAAVDESMSSDHRTIMKRVFVPGHNHAAEIADVDFRISQVSPEGLSRDEWLAKLQPLWDEKDAYEKVEDVPDDWTTEAVTDANGNPITYAAKWAASDFAGKREMLKEWKITAENVVIDGKRSASVVMVPRWEAWDAEPASGQATGADR
jgi:DNA invertase Pin-like site-specific DNA recombinase